MDSSAAIDHSRSPGHRANGANLVAEGGRELPLRDIRLNVDACAGIARVELVQHFSNPWKEPLAVTYSLPLPHDGVVSGFAFQMGERRIVGEVERRADAKEQFERALFEGRTGALLEQERGNLFTQQIGNIAPGSVLIAEITVDVPLAWLAEGAWEFRFPTVVAPRYLGAEGRVADSGRITQDVTETTPGPSLRLDLSVRDSLADGAAPVSSSHALAVAKNQTGWRIGLDPDATASLDRDVVVRWAMARPTPGITLDAARPDAQNRYSDAAYALLTVVPPQSDGEHQAWPRDLTVLLDVSGSMHGLPLTQAKRVAARLIESLVAGDTLEVIGFSSSAQRWQSLAEAASADRCAAAIEWVNGLKAGGGTEMVSGVLAALAPLRGDAIRQVVLITDGLVGFENEVVNAIRSKLPATSRLHCVGVGPAANRSLLAPCARAGRGTEVLLGLNEDATPATERLLAQLVGPLLCDLEISGDAGTGIGALDVPASPLPDLYVSGPVRIPLRINPAGGELTIRAQSPNGTWKQSVSVPPCAHGSGSKAIAALYARETIETLELGHLPMPDGSQSPTDTHIENLGIAFQIATQLTSWVAVSEEPSVDPREPFRRVKQPQLLPAGLSAEGVGLRRAVDPAGFEEALNSPAAAFAASSPLDYAETEARIKAGTPLRFTPEARRSQARSASADRLAPGTIRDQKFSRDLWARVVRREGDVLTFEIQFNQGASPDSWPPRTSWFWQIPHEVHLHFDNDSPISADVATTLTTQEGDVSLHASVRLAVTLRGAMLVQTLAPSVLHLVSAHRSWTVPVEP